VTVLAVLSRAVHVRSDDGRLLVIVDANGPSGPLHLRVDALPTVVAGDRLRLDLESVPRWTPCPVVGLGRRIVALPGAEGSALAGRNDLLDRVRAGLRVDDLDGVARLLGGLGPGLTPAGDDVLAGIVLARRLSGADETRLRAAIELVCSTELSLAYLRWAARGQCIEPAHEVLTALAAGDATRVAAACARLTHHGATSGADLLLGMQCGAEARRRPRALL
jgi:hypothetical protein